MEIKKALKEIARPIRDGWWKLTDPRRVPEKYGERMVFQNLKAEGFFDGLEGKRILEIGPKHGLDSRLLATLKPSELVLLDLPEKDSMVQQWLPELREKCKTAYYQGNILYLTEEESEQLGRFELVYCLGVVYHNVEQVRLLKRLFDLCKVDGRIVVESATTRNRRLHNVNVVEIHWPSTYRNVPTITHLPSRQAIKSWLEMVGFTDVRIRDVYSRHQGWQRAVLTALKPSDPKPYVSYGSSELNPVYLAGDAR